MKHLSFKSYNNQPHCKEFSKKDGFTYGYHFQVFI